DPRPAEELAPHVGRPAALLLRELLARDPDRRPADARVVVQRLRALESGGTPSAPSPVALPVASSAFRAPPSRDRRLTFGVWAGAAVVLAALVVGAFAAYHKFRAPEGGPGPEPAAGAAAAAPIRIGILFSLTGTLAVSERPIVDAAQLA